MRSGWTALLCAALLLPACERSGGSSATSAAPAAVAAAASAPASAPMLSAAPPGNLAGALVGTWRQLCQPYLPGDGASDITYTITLNGADGLHLAGVAKDYKNTSCAGGGSVIATPQFAQKIAGSTTLAGATVLRLVDAGAAVPAPDDAKSMMGIDQGRLRFGNATGARDSAGFPAAFEKPGDAYNRQ